MEYQVAVVLTNNLYTQQIQPLYELKFRSFKDAFDTGLINMIEFRFYTKQLGPVVPSLEEFRFIQQGQLYRLASIAR